MSINTGDRTAGLVRKYGGITATGIVIANMVGSGIFTSSGIMADSLPGPAWVILCWILGGGIALCGALSYGELATRMPEAGGEYVYLRRLYHPAFGFLTGWTSFIVGFSAPIALSALGITEYFAAGLAWRETVDPATLLWQKKLAAALIVIAFSFVHYVGHRFGSAVQNILTLFKIIVIVGLAAGGVFVVGFSNTGQALQWDVTGQSVGFGAAMMMVMFSYSGWNATAYIAAEIRKPEKNLPRSLAAGTAAVLLLYVLINVFYFSASQYTDLQGVVPVAEKAAVDSFGSWIQDMLTGMFGIALLSSLSAFILIGPRVYYAMAKDRLFFAFAAEVHPRYQVPGKAILLQGGLSVAMIIIGSFEQLLIYVGFSLGIFPLMAVAGLFTARSRRIGEEQVARVPLYPYIPLVFIVSTLTLMVMAYIERPLESTTAVATILLGIPAYWWWSEKIRQSSREADN